MANIRSQIKRNRQNLERHQRNKAVRSGVRTAQRRFREAVERGDREHAEEAYRAAARQLDKAASRGALHANKAANRKSRMSKQLQQL